MADNVGRNPGSEYVVNTNVYNDKRNVNARTENVMGNVDMFWVVSNTSISVPNAKRNTRDV